MKCPNCQGIIPQSCQEVRDGIVFADCPHCGAHIIMKEGREKE
jgi:ssDNA-binding Zn-finger/Zn-ribbon topoisomerase 1